MVAGVLIPRFALLSTLRDRETLLSEPVALAPVAGRSPLLGEVSAPAEAFGVAAGMRVGEALARCPELRLVPSDPEAARARWNDMLERLEGVGASPESDRAGEAFFACDGLRGIHGGRLEDVLAATRRALGRSIRLGAAPSRFCAYAAALQARPRGRSRGDLIVPTDSRARAFLAPLPVALLRSRLELAELPDLLERLGIGTLGRLASLPAHALSERFGHPGLRARELALGRDTPLDPRRPVEPVVERLGLPEAISGQQLERALELLIARLLARPERRGRSLRSLTLSARLAEGGTWRSHVTLRQASAQAARIRVALGARLTELPAPAESLGIEVEAFGPPAREQESLLEDGRPGVGSREGSGAASRDGSRAIARTASREHRLREAIHQARQAAGECAALRVLELDPGSRVPERRAALAPYPTEGRTGSNDGQR